MLRLSPHPQNGAQGIESFAAACAISSDGHLWLRYHVDCDPEILALAGGYEQVTRGDKLWESTVFEVFVQRPEAAAYLECNFSTGGQWAAYHFDGYRSGMRNQDIAQTPEIYIEFSDSHLALEATILLPPDFCDWPLNLAITSILHENDGKQSYWSLAHGDGPPDFHHQACFVHKVAAPMLS